MPVVYHLPQASAGSNKRILGSVDCRRLSQPIGASDVIATNTNDVTEVVDMESEDRLDPFSGASVATILIVPAASGRPALRHRLSTYFTFQTFLYNCVVSDHGGILRTHDLHEILSCNCM